MANYMFDENYINTYANPAVKRIVDNDSISVKGKLLKLFELLDREFEMRDIHEDEILYIVQNMKDMVTNL